MNPGGNPNPLDPQSFNQYAYNENNPIDAASSPDALGSGNDKGISFANVSTSGPQQDTINAVLNRLLANLPNDPQCLQFLRSKGQDPLDTIRNLQKYNLVGHADVFVNGNPLAITAISFGLVPGQATTVNNQGAFFNQTVGNVNLSVEGYAGGTPAAQAFTVLHELGHLDGVLEKDFGPNGVNNGAERRNSEKVEKNRKKTVKACSKRR